MTLSKDSLIVQNVLEQMARENGKEINHFSVLKKEKRPFSDVYRVRIDNKSDNDVFVYIKYLKNLAQKSDISGLKKNYETAQFWFGKLKESENFRTIEPLYLSIEDFAIVTLESPGYNLNRYIAHYGQFFPPLKTQKKIYKNLYKVGQWLNYFQDIEIDVEPKPIQIDDILAYINIRLNRIVKNSKIAFTGNLAGQINDYIAELWKDVSEQDKAQSYLHSDLSLSNILIHKDNVTVLDFGQVEIGSVYKDLTRLYHQLMLLNHKPTFLKGFLANIKENLLAGYGKPGANQHPLFRIYLLTHIINHLGKTARFWEHGFTENIYNRWIVRRTLKELREFIR